LFIRGVSSLNITNQPLIIVDGMIFDNNSYGTSLIPGYRKNPLGGIDINDIESVTVVKDAASIYGAKAANGVVLIRTTHADKQATTIDLNLSGGYELQPTTIPLLDAENYKTYLNEMLLTNPDLSPANINSFPYNNNDPSVPGYYTYHNSTDWQKEVFANSFTSNYGLGIKGGDDVALYALNVGYMKQGGIVEGSDNSRFNMRFNSDIKISKVVSLNSNIGFNYIQKNITGTGLESVNDPLQQARIKAPFLMPYDRNNLGVVSPDLADYDIFGVSNPVALVQNMKQEDLSWRLFGSFNFNVKANKNLTFSNLIGVVLDKERQSIFIPDEGVPPIETINGVITNQMKERVVRNTVVNDDLRAVYNNQFGAFHHLNGVAGARMNVNQLEEDMAADCRSPYECESIRRRYGCRLQFGK
jgi:TonB-dependent SusC/RagA subfamily outer membrane receptor